MGGPPSGYDYLLVGGGLQNGLLALALARHRPGARVALVEAAPRLGGNHTWCFHGGDLEPEEEAFVRPLVTYRWSGYDVRFPALERTIRSPYTGVSSERLHASVSALFERPGWSLLLGARAVEIGEREVRLEDGRRLGARAVIDARGPERHRAPGGCAFQKFVGVELQLDAPRRLPRPLLMDATVRQTEGYRFVYVLPLAPDRLLIEDTRFADDPELDSAALEEACRGYAERRGFGPGRVVRTERGVLPLPLSGGVDLPERGPIRAGYQGGWFHPVTGYSFPVAARLAAAACAAEPEELPGALWPLAAEQRRQLGFCFLLNRMLFGWFLPEKRYHVLERFYRLPEPTIRRFYAMRTTATDRARFFIGRPPRGLSLSAALSAWRSA